MRRSSGDLASVAASAARKSPGFLHDTCSSAANASLSSEVPIATPSARSASPSWRIWASKLTRHEPHADPLGHGVEVGAVLDDDRHRVAEDVLRDVVGAEQQQRARPVNRFAHRWRLLQVELAQPLHQFHRLLPQAADPDRSGARVRTIRSSTSTPRIVDKEVETAALERLGQLARVVRGQHHRRDMLGAHRRAQFRHARPLEVRQHLQQERFKLRVRPVDFVDEQQHRSNRRPSPPAAAVALRGKRCEEEHILTSLATRSAASASDFVPLSTSCSLSRSSCV